MAQLNNISVYKGEDVTLTFTMSPVTDITAWTITLTIKTNATDAAALLTVTPATLLTPASGIFTFALTHAQTAALTVGKYAYDIQRVDSGSAAVLSIGLFTVLQEVLY